MGPDWGLPVISDFEQDRRMKPYFALPIGFLLVQCAQERAPEVTPTMARMSAVELSKLEHGREVYLISCANCHQRVSPGTIQPEYWRKIIPHMADNADLSTGEQADVLNYLMAAQLEATPKRKRD